LKLKEFLQQDGVGGAQFSLFLPGILRIREKPRNGLTVWLRGIRLAT